MKASSTEHTLGGNFMSDEFIRLFQFLFGCQIDAKITVSVQVAPAVALPYFADEPASSQCCGR